MDATVGQVVCILLRAGRRLVSPRGPPSWPEEAALLARGGNSKDLAPWGPVSLVPRGNPSPKLIGPRNSSQEDSVADVSPVLSKQPTDTC